MSSNTSGGLGNGCGITDSTPKQTIIFSNSLASNTTTLSGSSLMIKSESNVVVDTSAINEGITLDGDSLFTVLNDSVVTLDNLTITGGNSSFDGGGIYLL